MGFAAFLILICWMLSYPFLYGQLFSRFFGLKKKIDHWILFFLHISLSLLLFVPLVLTSAYTFDSDIFGFVIVYVLLAVFEGLVWQFILKDRKMNGFFISAICNLIFMVTVVLCSLSLW